MRNETDFKLGFRQEIRLIGDLKLFDALKTRMAWHQDRQTVIAENIANANTPGYEARDLSEPDFKSILKQNQSKGLGAGALKQTNSMHLQAKNTNGEAAGKAQKANDWEITPSGNSVVLEEQMMKLAENQMDYQTITSLYTKSIKLMKIAIGK